MVIYLQYYINTRAAAAEESVERETERESERRA